MRGAFREVGRGVTYSYMQPVGTVVAFGPESLRDASQLDATALACEVLDADFPRIKKMQPGSLLLLLCESVEDLALAAAAKAARILRKRGGGEAALVLPPLPANPGPQALVRIERAARLVGACAVQPVGASWIDAVRCLIEPLAVFGLVGVEPREVHALVKPRAALLHASVERVVPQARDVLVSCRLRPSASLREVDEAARTVRELAAGARLVLAGPEVASDDGPRVLALSLL